MALPPSHAEIEELARMALAAMDNSESGCLPLDYLQGHKDGLEWAAQLAEANHPETGDWLYDDPIELAKAIRKGPDMPPAQPVAGSEPVAWTWHYREQWHVTNDKCRAEFVAKDGDVAVLPLYRQAQPAPEYPEVLPCPVLLEPGLRFGKGIKTSTMLAALARRAVHESDMAALSPEERVEFQARIEDFKALIAQPAPVVPDDVLDALQKVARIRLDLDEFDGDRRGIADCLGDAEEALIEVVNRRAAMLAAAPQSSGSEPATVPGKWIPVSERMPDENAEQQVLACFKGGDISTLYYFEGRWDDAYGIVPIRQDVTHWMPLPAAPKEAINALIPLVSRNEQEVK
ncbi:DUF551 domain-containing protein [Klebsiella quasipneumoniae]|nr:DUF551 domain-containing protein [Klebsiella quasipneumoniae]MDG0556536.1 DUF551 domain-containing protein [Klebsiella quasipneumoniae]